MQDNPHVSFNSHIVNAHIDDLDACIIVVYLMYIDLPHPHPHIMSIFLLLILLM
jgi:hypothetical protein